MVDWFIRRGDRLGMAWGSMRICTHTSRLSASFPPPRAMSRTIHDRRCLPCSCSCCSCIPSKPLLSVCRCVWGSEACAHAWMDTDVCIAAACITPALSRARSLTKGSAIQIRFECHRRKGIQSESIKSIPKKGFASSKPVPLPLACPFPASAFCAPLLLSRLLRRRKTKRRRRRSSRTTWSRETEHGAVVQPQPTTPLSSS